MIKKLKNRFIALAMISMFLLLALITVTANIVNYNYVISDTDKALNIFLHESKLDDPVENAELPPEHKRPRGEKEKRNKSKIPDTFMVDEYYSAIISPNGEVLETDRDHIPWLSEESAVKYALLAYKEDMNKGSVGIFRYHTDNADYGTLITLMNIDRELSACGRFLLISLLVGLCGYIVISIAIIFYSHRLTKPIAESYVRQKRFITNAGHELKTPLTIINANIELIEMDTDAYESVEEIKHQVARLTDMTNNLVYLSRMEEAEGSLTITEFPVSDIISEAVYPFCSAASAQNKKTEIDITPSLSFTGNSRSIQQLTSILMENALKYSPENSVIRVSLSKQGKHLIFSVENKTVCPISKIETEHIFERFYRTDISRNSETGGHGIGLSMAKAIVNAHNGKISAVTDELDSFRIIVQLPIK
ncbi:MAG: HAMP domain-containing histidine kinase [Clostridia bacterium]|nr:HAMP domain-containing histidine kinase [Clostridia bacterium]